MKKRQWSILAAGAVLALAFLAFNALKTPPPEESMSRSATARGVEVITLKNAPVTLYTQIDGRLNASQKISLYSEVAGVLMPGPKPFEAGITYQKGQVLLRLNNTEAKASFEASRTNYINTLARLLPDVKLDYPEAYPQWLNYLNQLNTTGGVPAPPTPQNDKLQLFLTSQGLYGNYQTLKSSQERLAKFTIKAPFSGTLTQALVETGSLVQPGQLLGEFAAQNNYELEASVNQQELEFITVGDSVNLISGSEKEKYTGVVNRINNKVNPNTQQVSIFVKLQGQGLQYGQFLSGRIKTKTLPNAVALPRTLLVEDSKVFVVQDSVLQKLPLSIVHKSPMQVVVTNLPNGTQVPKNAVPGAYSGMPVKIMQPR